MQTDQKTIRVAFFDELEKAEKEIKRLRESIEKISKQPACPSSVEALKTVSKRLSATVDIIKV